MVEAEVRVDSALMEQVQTTARQSGALMEKAFRRQMVRFRQYVQRTFRIDNPPPPPPLPFVWSLDPTRNARARAWYFANKVRDSSTPGRYRRTGALQKAWDVTLARQKDASVITLTNDADGAEFVVGERQVPSHVGWTTDAEYAAQFADELNARIEETWFTVADPFAGVPR